MTLVELLVAMVAMVIVIGGLVVVFMSQSRMSVSEEGRIGSQMNLRIATDRLSISLSHAGFGCHDSFSDGFSMTGSDPNGGTITVSSFVSNIVNNSSSGTSLQPDSVIVTYGIARLASLTSMSGEYVVTFANAGPAITLGNDFKKYLAFFPDLSGNVFYTVASSSGNNYTLGGPVTTVAGADVFMVSPVRIYLAGGRLYLQTFAHQAAVDKEQFWIVAENIEDLQFQYSLDGEKWYDTVQSSDLQKIRMIRFWLLGRSERASGAGPQILEISDLKVNVPGSPCVDESGDVCVLYRVGPFNDGHTRMLSRGEVVLRNVY